MAASTFGGSAMTTTALISPMVPNKRQRSDHSPPPSWYFHAQDHSARRPSHDAHWPEPPSRSSQGERSPPAGNAPTHESWQLPPIDSRPPLETARLPEEQIARSGPCAACTKVSLVAPQIVSGLDDLQSELSRLTLSGENRMRQPGFNQPQPPSVTPPSEPSTTARGVLQALDWSLERLNESVKVTREVISQSNQEKQAAAARQSENQLLRNELQRSTSRVSPPIGETVRRPPELPPLYTEGFRSSGSCYEPSSTTLGGSPPPYPSQNLAQSQAGASGDSSRVRHPPLPSPASLSISSSILLPPMSPSLQSGNNTRSPHTAHLEELQHQLSTKTLAHQVLSTEHEKLLSAYSRLQIRCGALDKKSTVSDAEIANLSEDRIRLQTELELAEARAAELQEAQDESQKQQAAHGDQYMQILSMGSRLQAQGAEEMKRWKADRDAWSVERAALMAKIKDLEEMAKDAYAQRETNADLQHDQTAREGDADTPAGSFSALRKEVFDLRRALREEQEHGHACCEEGRRLSGMLADLGNMSRRLMRRDRSQ